MYCGVDGAQDEPTTDQRSGLETCLEDARHIIEGKFLAAGDILSRSVKGSETLIASLDTLAAALNPATVDAMTNELKQTAAVLNGLPVSHQARVNDIAEMRKSRDSLAERIFDIRRALSYMQAFTVNIKIVAGGIGDAEGEFAVFAQDIADCIAQGIEKLNRIDGDLNALRERLEAADTVGAALGQKIAKLLPPLQAALSSSADAMDAHYRNVAATVEGVSRLARDIRQNAARILVALQIGDSTRQRIEHVQLGLTAAHPASLEFGVEASEQVATLVYALLCAHLSGAHADFDREVQQIDSNMAAMAMSARELMTLHGMAFGGGESGRGFLHELAARIEEAQELVAQIDEADAEARRTGQVTAQSAQALSVRIEEIQLLKNDVQYMALNTTIKCCQIGDVGRPLSVIALALRDHGAQVDAAAEQCVGDLDRLGQCAGSDTSEGETCTAAKDALSLAGERACTARDKTEADIAAIATLGDEVLHLLEESNERLRFREDIGEAMETCIAALGAMGRDAAPVEPDMVAVLSQAMAGISARYAMVQERDVHREFTRQWGLVDGLDEEAAEDDLEDMLF